MHPNRAWAAGLVILLLCGVGHAAGEAALQIKSASAQLAFDARGISLTPTNAACPVVQAKGDPVWAVLLQPDMAPPVEPTTAVLTNQGQEIHRERITNGLRVTYGSLTDGKRTWHIRVTLQIQTSGDAFEVTGQVKNDEPGWMICGFVGPVLNGIQADLATHPALLADGFGRRVNRVPTNLKKPWPWHRWGRGLEISTAYPSRRGTMQWCAFSGAKGGLYLGCHDADHGAKTFAVRYDPARNSFGLAVKHQAFCAAGKCWTLPNTVFLPYTGSWHTAAHYYRAWYDSVKPQCDVPDWVRDASGWLLCILKQQNGEVLWDYPALEALCQVADRRGLDILGLFGWAHGGHDHLYPDYFPDPKMGGEKALRTALKKVHQNGKRSIIYANGQLQERDTPFWQKQGKDLTIIKKDGQPVEQTWHKYRNAPAYQFGLGCLAAQGWYDRMLSLAIQANDLGADGILYDQLGVSGPMACYAAGHGHPVPSMVYAKDRVRFLHRIREHMRTVNPDFIVMTEGLHDSVLDSVALFHGCVLGMFQVSDAEILARLKAEAVSDAFPEMFRYTFPEVMSTVRVPTPMLDRVMVNYTCTYGLRYEIESRYAPDVRFLRQGKVPEVAEYEDVISKPNITMMRSVPQDESVRYLKQVIEFQHAYADLLLRGRFTDVEGLELAGTPLVAKGFTAGDRLGVVLWNPGDRPASFSLRVPGASLLSASDPEHGKVEALSALPAQSIRLLVWKTPGKTN